MPDIQLGAHTVKSHGIQIARTHMHDWLILLLLVVIEVVLNVIEPFHRFVGKDMLTDLSYPLQDNTVPIWAVPVCFSFNKYILQKRNYFSIFSYMTILLKNALPLITDCCNIAAHGYHSRVLFHKKECLRYAPCHSGYLLFSLSFFFLKILHLLFLYYYSDCQHQMD